MGGLGKVGWEEGEVRRVVGSERGGKGGEERKEGSRSG